MPENEYINSNNEDMAYKIMHSKWKLYSNEEFQNQLQNFFDFSDPKLEFSVDINNLTIMDIEFAKNLFKQSLVSLTKYLQINDETLKAFQLIDPRRRNMSQSIYLFREKLLKEFVSCYDLQNHYTTILNQFIEFSSKKDSDLTVHPQTYQIANDHIDAEGYWIYVLKKGLENPYYHLSKFIINLMTIRHSNCFVERVFSQVNLIKTSQRNCLDVSTVGSLLKVKTYYSKYEDDKSERLLNEKRKIIIIIRLI